jgi:alanyl-tRNA synthetase
MPKKEVVKEVEAVKKTTEELILNFGKGKYSAIPMAALWAKELKRREENRHLTPAEILDQALRDVLGGKVDWKDLKKVSAAIESESQAAAAAEKKGE